MISFETRLRRFPPIVCRLLARSGHSSGQRLMGDQEIADTTATLARQSPDYVALSVAEVRSLMWNTSWNKLTVSHALTFTLACGVDLSSRESVHKHSRYIRAQHRFCYLKRDLQYETIWKQLYTTYVDYLRSSRS